jgi:sugar transferase (PEP-CTERM system associated)
MLTRVSWPLLLLAGTELLLLSAVFAGVTLAWTAFFGDAVASKLLLLRASVISGLAVLMLYAMGLYAWHVARSYVDLVLRIFVAILLSFVLYAFLSYLFPSLQVPVGAGVPGFAMAVIAVVLIHDGFLRMADLAHLKQLVLILGTGPKAGELARLESLGRASRFRVAAFVDVEGGETAVPIDRIVGMPENLEDYARARAVDEVVLAPQDRRGNLPLEQLVSIRLTGVPISEHQSFCERVQGAVNLAELRPSWFFDNAGFRTSGWNLTAKRALDLTASGALLTFTLPVLVLTAIAIKLESPGPVLYRQQRIGRGGRPFTLVKFRSMRRDAERLGRAQWASVGDARITRVGKVIRKTRIDEIPQALNVLRGEMSFVGPRPERPEFVELLAREIPFYRERHCVKPGITGWAQLNYPYGASIEDARQKLSYDLYYIKHFSVMFDFAIIFQTVRVVLFNEGAR